MIAACITSVELARSSICSRRRTPLIWRCQERPRRWDTRGSSPPSSLARAASICGRTPSAWRSRRRAAISYVANAIVTPLYTISLAFIFIAGFAAVLLVPGLSNGDMSLLMLARKSFPAWFLGVIGGAGALNAMLPAAIIILTASTLFAKNVYRPLFAPQMAEDRVARLAKTMVLVLALTSFYLALHSSTTLVALLLLGYAGSHSSFPALCWAFSGHASLPPE